jgi:hypothetical protein
MCATVPQFPHDLQYGRLKDPPSPGTIASWSLPLFPPHPMEQVPGKSYYAEMSWALLQGECGGTDIVGQ